jgi:hypothetical protein
LGLAQPRRFGQEPPAGSGYRRRVGWHGLTQRLESQGDLDQGRQLGGVLGVVG